METIYKYPFSLENMEEIIEAPQGANFLYADYDCNNIPCLWADVITTEPLQPYKVFSVPTGADFANIFPQGYQIQKMGIIKDPPYIWHIFIGVEQMVTFDVNLDDLNEGTEIPIKPENDPD